MTGEKLTLSSYQKVSAKLNINGYDDRRSLISILVSNGYRVYQEVETNIAKPDQYFIVVDEVSFK